MDANPAHSDLREAETDALLTLWTKQAGDHAILVLDKAGVITGWRGAAENILGFTAAEAIGQHVSLIFTHEDRDGGYPSFELHVAAEDRFSEDSRWHVRKDGIRIWVTGTVTAVRDPKRQILGFVKVLRDVTDQRTQLERMENKVAELGDARDQTHTFLRTLGHEIRNPLAVLSNLQMIISRLSTDDRLHKVSDQLRDQVSVLKRLADDLMDIARLELGRVELELQELDLRDLLKDCAASMKDRAALKAVDIEVIVPAGPLMVRVDAVRIQQVISNLLHNAIKYNKQGGSVWVTASAEGNEVLCRVQDTGIGIFPPVLPKLFEMFSQAPEGKEMRQGGIGVGLALVRQIVELHGGTVQAKSPGLGKGSEFLFRLPVIGGVPPLEMPVASQPPALS